MVTPSAAPSPPIIPPSTYLATPPTPPPPVVWRWGGFMGIGRRASALWLRRFGAFRAFGFLKLRVSVRAWGFRDYRLLRFRALRRVWA